MPLLETNDPGEKLMRARCRLLTTDPFYGHACIGMVWIKSDMNWMPEEQRTMGVRIVNGGEIQCLWYPGFVDRLNTKELMAIVQHEIEHIIRVHCVRCGHRHPLGWNVAADMTVNGPKDRPRIGYKELNSGDVIIPDRDKLCWIPKDWPQDETTETYYEKVMKNVKCTCNAKAHGKGQKGQKGQQGQGQGQGDGEGDEDGENEGQGQGKCPKCNGGGQGEGQNELPGFGKIMDDHSTWNQSDVSEDEARQVVKDMVDQVVQKCQGHVPGHLEAAIKALGKAKVRWRELLRQYLGRHVGNRRVTYCRRNRRRDWFGVPGVSHHAAATVVVITDTSGSVGNKELEQFYAEIDQISGRAKVFVLQWDHAFQGYAAYRRGDWKKFKIHGRGGTDMIAPFEYLERHGLVADCQILLTDGECQWPEKKAYPVITVITTDAKGPDFGHVVRMKVAE